MPTPLNHKKFLLLALLEDFLFILFLFTFLASGLEILLPGILANKMPLAFLFTLFAFLLFVYSYWIKKERLPYPRFYIPRVIFIILIVVLVAVTLFMNRDFGIWGAILQCILISGGLFYYWYSKK